MTANDRRGGMPHREPAPRSESRSATLREFVCNRCERGQCARCNDHACTCCYGNED